VCVCMCVCIYIYYIFFIHSPIVGYLCWFYSLSVANSAAINMGVQVSFLYVDLHSFKCVPKSGITSHQIVHFSFLMTLHADFPSGCTSL
jgi:hypothetical protein